MNRFIVTMAFVCSTTSGCGLYSEGLNHAIGNTGVRSEYRGPVSLHVTNNSMRRVIDVRVRPMVGPGIRIVGADERVLEQGTSLTVENIPPDRWEVIATDEAGNIQRGSIYVKSGVGEYEIDRSYWKRPPRASND